MTDRSRGILSILASAFGFSMMAFFVRLADDCGESLSAFQKGFFRNAVAFAIASFVLARKRGLRPFPVRAVPVLLLRCLLGTVGIFANFHALGRIPIAEAQTLNKTAPFFTVAAAWLFLGEKASARQFAALAIAFAGVVLVAKPGFAGPAALPLLVALLGGVCAGGAYACLRSLRRRGAEPASIVFFFSLFSCIASLPFFVFDFTPMTSAQTAVLVLAGVSAALGQFGITAAYGFAAPREIAVYDYSSIVFTALLGFVFFGQLPDALSFAGFALVVFAAAWMHSRIDAGRRKMVQSSP